MNRTELPALPSAPTPKGLGWPAFLLALVMVGALAHVAVRLHVLELAYDLARQRKVQSALEEQRRRLQTEIGMLKDPNRIVALARDGLHMGPPMAEDIRRLHAGMSLRPAPPPDASAANPARPAARAVSRPAPRPDAEPAARLASGPVASAHDNKDNKDNKVPAVRRKAEAVSAPEGAELEREAAE